MDINFTPIGVVRTKLCDEDVKTKQPSDLEAEIEVFKNYAEGLEAIDGFSHLIVIFYLHKVTEKQRQLLKAQPRRLIKYGLTLEDLPSVGVFCLDSPHRPNPIGLSVVKLLWRKDCTLKVKGLDAFNKTPILDLKPYSPQRKIKNFKLPEWYNRILSKIKAKGYKILDF